MTVDGRLDLTGGTYLSYRAAIKLVSDWDTLAEIASEFTRNERLTEDQKDDLVRAANEKERELRPGLFRVRFKRKEA